MPQNFTRNQFKKNLLFDISKFWEFLHPEQVSDKELKFIFTKIGSYTLTEDDKNVLVRNSIFDSNFVNSTNSLQKMGNLLSFYHKERTEVLYFTLYVEVNVSFFQNQRYYIIHNIW